MLEEHREILLGPSLDDDRTCHRPRPLRAPMETQPAISSPKPHTGPGAGAQNAHFTGEEAEARQVE